MIRVTRAGREPFMYLRVIRCVLFSTVLLGVCDVVVEVVGAWSSSAGEGCVLMCQIMLTPSVARVLDPKSCGVHTICSHSGASQLLSAIYAATPTQTKDPRTVKYEGLS